MKFGLQISMQHPASDSGVGRFKDHLEQVRLARDIGFDSVWASQHYLSTPFQYFQPIPTLARVSAESGEMTLGTGIILLALHHPVEIAEEIATLDMICQGRFIFGVGLGYRDEEYQAFGVPKRQAVSRFIEALMLIKRLWTEDHVTFQGKHFHLSDVTLTTRPSQKPHPPIWIGANSDAAVKRAAEMGDAWIINPHADFSTLERQVELYKETLHVRGKPFPGEFPIIKELYLAEDRYEAMKECRPFLEAKYQVYVAWGQDKVMPEDDALDRPFEQLQQGRFIIGDPELCIEQIEQYRQKLGVTHMIFRAQWPGMEQAKVLRTIRLFGERVLPRFRVS
ncbi:MAG: LLM class flavin-dependent oxidoreductase [Candidatus Tectomicrobia bacterium]|nr:LLM class flavin-dependent oxidoreductase [Candidatus Tectomicrobia bacterium]